MKHEFSGLLRDKTAAGTIRFRVRVEGQRNKKIKIPVGPREPTFHEYYAAARAGERIEIVKPVSVKVGTLDELCDKYLAFIAARVEGGTSSKLTLQGHKSLLMQACNVKDDDGDRMGSLSTDMPEAGFMHIQDSFGSRTGAADNCIKALRAAYRWGEKRGYPKKSPVLTIEKVHANRGGAVPWHVSEMQQFLKFHRPGSMARLWFFISINTLPRIGDVGAFSRKKHLIRSKGHTLFCFQPSKKGSASVSVPALKQLLEELELHGDRETLLQTEAGNPFASPESLRNKIQDWTSQAGLLSGRTQHGIRKGAAHFLADAGATQYEIMCLMAHTQAKTSEVYTKDLERAQLSARAIAKMSAMDFEKVDHGE